MSASRLERLRRVDLPGGLVVLEAATPRARLLGLALLDRLPESHALLLRDCSSVHTFGMRFALDVMFLDAAQAPVRVVYGLRPRRLVRCAGARSVLETRAGEGARFLTAGYFDTGPRASAAAARRALSAARPPAV